MLDLLENVSVPPSTNVQNLHSLPNDDTFSFPPQAHLSPPPVLSVPETLDVPHAANHLTTRPQRVDGEDHGMRLDLDGASVVVPVLKYSRTFVNRSVDALQQASHFRQRGIIHFSALCWCLFIEGWNDGTIGPLLPTIQRDYNIGFLVVSLLFVSNCIGFITGALLNVWINDKLGFGKVVVIGAICQLATYAIMAPAPPFALMVLSNALCGFGLALQNAQANGFVSSLKSNASTKLNILHACYGLGAFASPFTATYFSGTKNWSFHYLVSTGMAVSNVVLLLTVFRLKPQDDILAEAGQEPAEISITRENKYRQILGLKSVHYLAIFSLIYIGVEVTLGGWIVTFIIEKRDGGHSAGYISSGFFGGLTLGRIALMWLSKLVGEHRVIFLYGFLAIVLEITVWVVPSIIENAVAVSFIGLLLGPMFPIIVSHASNILPRRLLTASVGWITGIGMAGSAALPFLTGVFSSKFGIGSLQPLIISMMCCMIGFWAMVPKSQRRAD